MGRTVGELEQVLTPREWSEWRAYELLEPWGYHIENFRAAMGPFEARRIAAAQAGKHSRVRIEDYMRKSPVSTRRKGPVSAESVMAAFAPFIR